MTWSGLFLLSFHFKQILHWIFGQFINLHNVIHPPCDVSKSLLSLYSILFLENLLSTLKSPVFYLVSSFYHPIVQIDEDLHPCYCSVFKVIDSFVLLYFIHALILVCGIDRHLSSVTDQLLHGPWTELKRLTAPLVHLLHAFLCVLTELYLLGRLNVVR